MSSNRVFVSYTETYDINTVNDKLTVIGFHTPTTRALVRSCSGLYSNFQKVKINNLDIAVGSVAQQPVDPLGVGIEAGQIPPQDVINPLLFKTVTGESLNVLLNTIYSTGDVTQTKGYGSITKAELPEVSDNFSPFDAYYTLLSDNRFRAVHPQQGLIATGIKPMVHEIVANVPFSNSGTELPEIAGDGAVSGFGHLATVLEANGNLSNRTQPVTFMNSGLRPMPPVPTFFEGHTAGGTATRVSIPKVWCAVLVLPPCIATKQYFRLRLKWDIEFIGMRPSYDLISATAWEDTNLYYNLTDSSGAAIAMELESGSLDANGVENVMMVTSGLL